MTLNCCQVWLLGLVVLGVVSFAPDIVKLIRNSLT